MLPSHVWLIGYPSKSRARFLMNVSMTCLRTSKVFGKWYWFLHSIELAFKHETGFPQTWRQTLKVLYCLGQAGLETVWICDEPDHAHIFEQGETVCPTCGKPKPQCATQATVSIRETLSHELRSPVTCLKLLDFMSGRLNEFDPLIFFRTRPFSWNLYSSWNNGRTLGWEEVFGT